MLKITSFRLALLITAVLITLYFFFGQKLAFLQVIELKILDARFKVRGPQSVGRQVTIVAIDDYSIEKLGRWPWPRSYHAELINCLAQDGAKAVGIDLILTEPDENYERIKLRELRQYYHSLSLDKAGSEGEEFGRKLDQVVEACNNDRQLAKAMNQYGHAGVGLVFRLPADKGFSEEVIQENSRENSQVTSTADLTVPPFNEDSPALDEDIPVFEILDQGESPSFLPDQITAAALSNIVQPGNNLKKLPLQTAEDLLLPLSEFYINAKCLGHINFSPDIDGSLRWETLVIEFLGKYYPALGIQLLREFWELQDHEVRLYPEKGIALGSAFVPFDDQGRLLINYYGPSFTFPYYSFSDVVQRLLPAGTFQDKIVLVGGAATGVGDVWPTPFSESFPGVEKHATMIMNILQNNFLSSVSLRISRRGGEANFYFQ